MTEDASQDSICHDGARAWTCVDLLADVQSVQAKLQAAAPGSVLLVFEQDRFALLVALLATWREGRLAVMPPDLRRATLAGLKSQAAVVLHDTVSGLAHRVEPVGATSEAGASLPRALPQGRLRLFGASARGRNDIVELSTPQLAEEAERWSRGLAASPGRVVSSAPCQHRFGLMGGVLWPFLEGGSFWRRSPSAAEPSPGWSDHEVVPAHRPAGPTPTISGGGLRAPDGGLDLFTLTGLGAVAKREGVAWRVLPGVKLEPTRAGTRFSIGRASVETEDRFVGETSGRFELRHRAGREAETSRGVVDLDELTAKLRTRVEVSDLIVEVVGPSVVVLAKAPAEALEALEQEVQAALPGLEPRVQVSSQSIRDGMGRVPLRRLLAKFGLGPHGRPRATQLIDLAPMAVESEGHGFMCTVPKDYRWFDGHFEGYPILPAAVQLHEIIVPLARRAGLVESPPTRFDRLKFSGRIEPGHRIEVRFTVASNGAVDFEIQRQGKRLSAGRMRGVA